MKFTEKLKELREAKRLTQRQLAALLDIDVTLYNRFEKGERNMKSDMVERIASVYSIQPSELRKYWLAEKVYNILSLEENASEVICMVSEDISEYKKE